MPHDDRREAQALVSVIGRPTAALILAAGASTRLGHPKQLALLNGEPLLVRAIRTVRAAGLGPILVLLGANAGEIQATCNLDQTHAIVNPDWQEGMASSIRLGIQALAGITKKDSPEGAILMTCDQPAVDANHLRQLIREGRTTGEPVASMYGDQKRRGVPAYFPDTRFSELLLLHGDTGARSLLASATAIFLNLGELDIDTPEALAHARTIFERSSGT